jgi:uncharacterized protein YjeT (DUF2065 family)
VGRRRRGARGADRERDADARSGAGGAVATCLGYVTAAVLTYAMAQRVHPLPYRGLRLLGLFALACGLAIATHVFAPGGVVGVGMRLAAVAGFVAVCGWSGIWKERGAVAPHGR